MKHCISLSFKKTSPMAKNAKCRAHLLACEKVLNASLDVDDLIRKALEPYPAALYVFVTKSGAVKFSKTHFDPQVKSKKLPKNNIWQQLADL